MDYRLYEKLKRELQTQDLMPAEYERAIREIVWELESDDLKTDNQGL